MQQNFIKSRPSRVETGLAGTASEVKTTERKADEMEGYV